MKVCRKFIIDLWVILLWNVHMRQIQCTSNIRTELNKIYFTAYEQWGLQILAMRVLRTEFCPLRQQSFTALEVRLRMEDERKEWQNVKNRWWKWGEKGVKARGEIDSHRLARSFTNSVLDSLWGQNGCALHRPAGLCWATETGSKNVKAGRRERWIHTDPVKEGLFETGMFCLCYWRQHNHFHL